MAEPKIGEIMDWVIEAGWSNTDLRNAVMRSKGEDLDFRFIKIAMFRRLMIFWLPLVDLVGSAALMPLAVLYERHGDTVVAWLTFQTLIVILYVILMCCIASIDDKSRRY